MRRSQLAVFVALTGVSSTAFAHAEHVATVADKADGTFSTSAAWQVGSFNFSDSNRGHWQRLAIAANLTPTPWLGLGATVPWGYVRLADGRGALGLGDLEASATVAHTIDNWQGSTGVAIGLPTGDSNVGLGAGHLDISPFVGLRFSPWAAFAIAVNATQRLAISNSEDVGVPHGALLAPHANRETAIAVTTEFGTEDLTARLGGAGVLTSGVAMGGTVANGQLEFRPTTKWSIAADVAVPITGFHRFEWRSGVLTTFTWN